MMKLYLLFILLSIFSIKNSYATCLCSEPTEPYIPSGYSADQFQMESTENEVEYYITEVQDYKQCLIDCIEDANTNAENVLQDWNYAVQSYNNR